MQLKWGINILQANNYVYWVIEWRFNIYGACWTMFIAFQMKKTPRNMFILFVFLYISFEDEEKPQIYS